MYGDYRRIFLRYFLSCLPLEFVLRGFAVCSYQRPLYWQKIKDGWSTMSDGIFDGMFLIVHRTFLVSYFRGCWLLDCCFFFVLKACGHIIERLSSCAVAVFIKQLQQHGHAKLNFWRRKSYGIQLDSYLYLSWFTATIKHDRLLV